MKTCGSQTRQTGVANAFQGGMERVSCTHNGEVDMCLPRDIVPETLVRAYEAAMAGHDCVLSPDAVRQLDEDAVQSENGDLLRLILAEVFKAAERPAEAEALLETILVCNEHAYVLTELAVLAARRHRYDRAAEYRERALAADPDNLWMQGNVAVGLVESGRIEEGVARLKAIFEHPEAGQVLCTKYLWNLQYLPNIDRKTVYEAHLRWGRRFGKAEAITRSYTNAPVWDRRLRIGYVSADFQTHSVAYTFENLLDGRSPERVEVFGYGSVFDPDETTARLASKFDHYRDIRRLDDRKAAELIQQDGIDILVFLAGLTGGNRVGVALLKPAPVQVDYGAIATYGITQMDYRLTHVCQDPVGSEAFYTERLVRLPLGFTTYRPSEQAGVVGDLPALKNGHITFGSFSNHCKINKTVIALWGRVLKDVPDARLLLKTRGANHSVWVDWMYREFERQGVARDRISLVGWMDLAEHFNLYNQIDIALDTYPYNGGLTTLEGLWMGVPAITLAGPTYTSCVGREILTQIGMAHCVASTPDQYVVKAVGLTGRLDTLVTVRRCLRSRMMQSPLCDAVTYGRQYEAALHRMWKQWCLGGRT